MAEQIEHPPRVLRRREVERRIGIGRSTIYSWIAERRFPAPVKLGAKSVGWLAQEIDDWVRDRVAAREASR